MKYEVDDKISFHKLPKSEINNGSYLEDFFEVPDSLEEKEISEKPHSNNNSKISISIASRRNSIDLALYTSNNLKKEMNKDFKNSRSKDPYPENFNSITSKTVNLFNMQPLSCERSKISTNDSLHSKVNYNLKDFSDHFNISKDYLNLKILENKNERNFILKENAKTLRNQLKFVNNSNNESNENINLNLINSSFFEQQRINPNFSNINMNNNNNNPNNHLTNFRIKTNFFNTKEENNDNSKLKMRNKNNQNSNSEFESEKENEYEDNKLNTIYESCYSPNSNSILGKFSFENKISNDIYSNINVIREGFDLNDFQSAESEDQLENFESDEALIETTKNINELRTKILNLNLDFFKVKGKNKPFKVLNKYCKETHFSNLIELQVINTSEFQSVNSNNKKKEKPSEIIVLKISHDSNYLAIGKSHGEILVYEILNLDYFTKSFDKVKINDNNYFNLLNDLPLKRFKDQKKDIIEICWSFKNSREFYSASLDYTIMKYSVDSPTPLLKLDHKSMLVDEERIISFSANKYLTVWGEESNEIKLYECYLKQELITSINYSPDGKFVFLGDMNGKCYKLINNIEGPLKFDSSFFCRNKYGRYSNGRKITNIEFSNNSNALITTTDSRLRLIDMREGILIEKFKGHSNFNKFIKAHHDEANDLIIAPSEDNYVYVWQTNRNNNVNNSNCLKNNQCEYFRPFTGDRITNANFVPEHCLEDYISKTFLSTKSIQVLSLIINSSEKGKIQVLLNYRVNQAVKNSEAKRLLI